MAKLSQEDLNIIEKYCGSNYVQRCRGILERNKDNTVTIVNTGMVSSGKSSLFNIFINSMDEYFPTGAARTTTRADYCDYNNISYIDTPGIDVRSEDDALAFSTIMKADIIIMVHNIKTGPLNRSEVEWLSRIVGGMKSADMCKLRLIFVNTWKDTREKDEDYAEIVSNVKNMVYQITGTEIPCFEVSNKKYLDGLTKGKKILTRNSGIQELREYLENYATVYLKRKQKIDQDELNSLIFDIRTLLISARESKNVEIEKVQKRVRDNYKSKRSAWQQVHYYFSTKRNTLNHLKDELNNM